MLKIKIIITLMFMFNISYVNAGWFDDAISWVDNAADNTTDWVDNAANNTKDATTDWVDNAVKDTKDLSKIALEDTGEWARKKFREKPTLDDKVDYLNHKFREFAPEYQCVSHEFFTCKDG